MEEMINAGKTTVGKPEETRPLGRQSQGRENAVVS
jgi:hypothetical protein